MAQEQTTMDAPAAAPTTEPMETDKTSDTALPTTKGTEKNEGEVKVKEEDAAASTSVNNNNNENKKKSRNEEDEEVEDEQPTKKRKTPKKVVEGEEEEEEEEQGEEEDQDEEEENANAESNVAILSSRGRPIMSVQRLSNELLVTKKKPLVIIEGKGERLGDIPAIEEEITKLKSDDPLLKMFHALVYKRPGEVKKARANLRAFTGFVYEDKEKERGAIIEKLTSTRWTVSHLKQLCRILQLETGGEKSVIAERVVDFLEKPYLDKKNSRKSVTPKKKSTPSKKKSPASSNKSGSKKSSPTKSTKSSKASSTKSTPTKTKTKKQAPDTISDSDDEDEPILKTQKKKPTDSEIRAVIDKLLKTADLSVITPKQVRAHVSEHFGIDMTDRKDFLKTVTQEIVDKMT